MRKIVLFCLGLTFMASFFSSCNDDEKVYLNIDESFINKGIVCGMQGGVFEIPVSSNGDWFASVADNVNWVSATGGPNYGDNTLLIVVDANNTPTTGRRDAVVIIKAGDEERRIQVLQKVLSTGAFPSSTYGAFAGVSTCYALGAGYDFATGESKQSVINMEIVKKLIEMDKDGYEGFDELFNYSKYPVVEGEIAIIDSVESKVDTLGITAKLFIGYNLFKFEIGGDIRSGEERFDSTFHYLNSTNYPLVAAQTSLSSAVAWYNDRDNDDYSDYKKPLTNILSKGVRSMMTKIENDYKENDTESFNADVDMLVNEYGTMVLTNTQVGGSAYLDAVIDTSYTTSYLKVDNAYVTTAIEVGLFKLNLDVSVDYTKQSTDILSHSFFSYRLMGGDKLQNVYNALTVTPVDPQNLRTELTNWMGSLNADLGSDKFNSVVLSMTCTPIWIIFDGALSNAVKERILATHPEKEMDIFR